MHKVIEIIWNRVITLAKDFSNLSSQQHEQRLIKSLEALFVITNQENGYISFFLTMQTQLNPECSISLSFLRHVIEKSGLPSQTTLAFIIEQLTKETTVNGMILFGLLSQRFSGHLCEKIWTDQLCTFLIRSLFGDNNKDNNTKIRIYALLALDGFAMTGAIKHAILSHPLNIRNGLMIIIKECENNDKRAKYKKITYNNNNKKWWWLFGRQKKTMDLSDSSQLEHCAKWSVDHIFGENEQVQLKEVEEKKVHYEQKINKYTVYIEFNKTELKVVLDKVTATSHCKLSRDYLAVRNDQTYFESIRATACVFSGKWYFEVLIFTSGIIHIGWSTFQSKFQPELGYGVGDDPYGFGFDTYRSAIWCAGKVIYPSKSKHIQCQPGDVIGSFLDADKRICSFFVNGQEIAHFKYSKRLQGLYPSFSLSTFQHIRVNFGDRPWCYHQRKSSIQLRPIKRRRRGGGGGRSARRISSTSFNDDLLCVLCFAEPKNVMLLPCRHTDFCHACSKLIKQCPLCRSDIQHIVIKNHPLPSSSSSTSSSSFISSSLTSLIKL